MVDTALFLLLLYIHCQQLRSCEDCQLFSKHCLPEAKYQEPVVQSIVSLTISLRHKFVKEISAKLTNTLLFFVETKNNSVFVILQQKITVYL